jgi:hypothetical protein
MRSTAVRLIVSAFAGIVTFYAIGYGLRFGVRAETLFYRYCDVFGLATALARIADRDYHPGDEMGSFVAERIGFFVMITFWSLLFGFLYFRFVFRAPRTI